jgi:hypothetical protein
VELDIQAADAPNKKSSGGESSPKPERSLLKEYTGNEQLPEALYETYSKLIEAMATGEDANIQKYCLPKSIKVGSEARRGNAGIQRGAKLHESAVSQRRLPEVHSEHHQAE